MGIQLILQIVFFFFLMSQNIYATEGKIASLSAAEEAYKIKCTAERAAERAAYSELYSNEIKKKKMEKIEEEKDEIERKRAGKELKQLASAKADSFLNKIIFSLENDDIVQQNILDHIAENGSRVILVEGVGDKFKYNFGIDEFDFEIDELDSSDNGPGYKERRIKRINKVNLSLIDVYKIFAYYNFIPYSPFKKSISKGKFASMQLDVYSFYKVKRNSLGYNLGYYEISISLSCKSFYRRFLERFR